MRTLLFFLLALLVFTLFFGCTQTSLKENTANDAGSKEQEGIGGISEEDLPVIEDYPTTMDDTMPEIEP